MISYRSSFQVAHPLLLALSLFGCAGSNKPEPENASGASASGEAEASDEELLATAKSTAHQIVCDQKGAIRACTRAGDDAACAEAFEALWPKCNGGFVNLREGDSDHWYKVGQEFAKCAIKEIEESRGKIDKPEEEAACLEAAAAAK